MGLFDFLKSKPIDYYNVGVTFRVDDVPEDVYEAVLVNDYVNLRTVENRNDVRIYAPDKRIRAQIGVVPSKYLNVVKSHLLRNEKIKAHDSNILEKSSGSLLISIKLKV
ncbi:MAG: hypothetical protein RLO81_12380 [Fulvivirga sp.]|uniref:hypothetical protein n=1 Tax=Fulvivirga sp. TaxID=1931237 RepID=UPI0032EBADF7